jgi:glycosyltransferase involved in cell wall biosynthesis
MAMDRVVTAGIADRGAESEPKATVTPRKCRPTWGSRLDRVASAGSGARVVAPRDSIRSPRVTIVVPCYNYGHYLPGCVGRLLEQPGVVVDVVIVDDASTDNSLEVAKALAVADDRVRVLAHERNAGHIATYNDGLVLADGDYVVLLSADDLLTPGSLARATALMEAHPSVGLVYGHAVRFSDPGCLEARVHAEAWTLWSGHDWMAARFRAGRNCLLSPEAVMRVAVQREIGGYDPELPHSGDLEMWLRAAAVADVGFVNGADQAWYRVHDSNMHRAEYQVGETSGMTIDLRERLRAFEMVADRLDREPAEAERLLDSARTALAVEALTLALRAHYWGIASAWPVDDLVAFAREACPNVEELPKWRALKFQREVGAAWPRHNPLSVSHELVLRVQAAARDWRFARSGL